MELESILSGEPLTTWRFYFAKASRGAILSQECRRRTLGTAKTPGMAKTPFFRLGVEDPLYVCICLNARFFNPVAFLAFVSKVMKGS